MRILLLSPRQTNQKLERSSPRSSNFGLWTLDYGVIAASLLLPATAIAAPAENTAAPADKTFKAGAYAINVSPLKFPVIINGGMTERTADKITDPLHARCLVLD